MEKENKGLRAKVIRGLGWSTGQTVGSLSIQVVTIVVLSRILSPTEVGIVAAAMGVIYVLMTLGYLGTGAAIIQRQEIGREHIGTALLLNLAVAMVLIALVFLVAPWLEKLLGIDQVEEVLLVLAILILGHAWMTLLESLATRDLRFRLVATVDFAATTVGYCGLSIACALLGFGLWSLVAGHLGRVLLKAIVLAFVFRRRLSLAVSRSALSDLLHFGLSFTLGKGASDITSNLDRTVIGGLLGADIAGLYARSRQVLQLGNSLALRPIDIVLFPAMSKVQKDPAKLQRAFYSASMLISLMTLPAVVVVILISDPLVPFILGEQWTGIVLPMQILSLSIFLSAATWLGIMLARSVGQVRSPAVIQVITSILVFCAIGVAYPGGLEAICWGLLVVKLIGLVLTANVVGRVLGIGFRKMLVPVVPGLMVAGSFAAFWWVYTAILGSWAQSVPGATVYIVLVGLTFCLVLLLVPGTVLTRDLMEIRASLLGRILGRARG